MSYDLQIEHLPTSLLLEMAGEIDETLSVIVKTSTVAPTLSIEKRMAKLLSAAWKGAAAAALDTSIGAFLSRPATSRTIKTLVTKLGIKLASPLTKAQIELLRSQVDRIWKIAKKIKATDAKIKLNFGAVDKRAVGILNRHQVFWVGDFYSDKLSNRIAAVSRDVMLERGLSREVAGKELHQALKQEFGLRPGGRSRYAPKVPASYAGNPDRYFEAVAANASHQARTFASIVAFEEAGVITYSLDNPMDERTGAICQQMNGQTFSVTTAVDHMNRILDADTPADVKDTAPWLSAADLKETLGGASAGSKDATGRLEAVGAILPPFHHLCRTDVVILDDGGPARVVDPDMASSPRQSPSPVFQPTRERPVAVPEPVRTTPAPIGNPLPLGLPKGVTREQISTLSDAELRASCLGDIRAMPLSTLQEVKEAQKAVRAGVEAAREITRALTGPRYKAAKKWLKAANADRRSVSALRKGSFAKRGRSFDGAKSVADDFEQRITGAGGRLPEAAVNMVKSRGYVIERIPDEFCKSTCTWSPNKAIDYNGLHMRPWAGRKGNIKIRDSLYRAPGGPEATMLHETGHAIDATTDYYFGRVVNTVGKGEYVSEYAKKDAAEMLAEVYGKLFVRGYDSLARTAPVRANVVNSMNSSDEAWRRGWMLLQRGKRAGVRSISSMEQLADDIIQAAVKRTPAPTLEVPAAVKPLPKPVKVFTPPPVVKPPVAPPVVEDLTKIDFRKFSANDIRKMVNTGKEPLALTSLPKSDVMTLRTTFRRSADVLSEAIRQRVDSPAVAKGLARDLKRVQKRLAEIDKVLAGG